jgi:hypothetical protein
MIIDLDIFELSWLLESAMRGSHLRASLIKRFVDEVYPKLTPTGRGKLYTWMLRNVYDGSFAPRQACCGADETFMLRYDPDNQYLVMVKEGAENVTVNAYERDGEYWIGSRRKVNKNYIISVERTEREVVVP